MAPMKRFEALVAQVKAALDKIDELGVPVRLTVLGVLKKEIDIRIANASKGKV